MVRNSKKAVLDAAIGLLRGGQGSFTYERLAADAGVSRQTVYTHFPDRAALLVAAVDRQRSEIDPDDTLALPVFDAPTARAALDALLDFHVAFTLPMLPAMRAVEAQRASDPAVSKAFERRSLGRRQLVRHVVTRLRAEGDLADDWTVEEGTDLVAALLAGGFTSELVDERHWTAEYLRDALRRTIHRTLLATPSANDINTREGITHDHQPHNGGQGLL